MKPLRSRLLVSLMLLAAGCSSSSSGPNPSQSSDTVYSAVPLPGQPLDPNGRYHGVVQKVDTAGPVTRIDVDIVQLLTGEPAFEAAAEDGADAADIADSGVYIRNRSGDVRTLAAAPNIRITLVNCSKGCRDEKVDAATLQEFVGGEYELGKYYGTRDAPFDIVLDSGGLVRLEEVYLP